MLKPYYERNGIVIYLGDCREILPQLTENVDLVLTDPPYGITNQEWDNIPDWITFGKLLFDAVNPDCQMFLFGMQPTYSKMIIDLQESLHFKDEIVWYYRDGGAGNTKGAGLKNVHQNIAWFSKTKDAYKFDIDSLRISYQPNKRNDYPVKRGKKIWLPNAKGAYPVNVFEFPKHKEIIKGKTQFHSHYTIKPIKLLKHIISGFSIADNLVLDPFLGSGTTALASKQLGRRCIGIEIEERYVEIAVKRLSQEVMDLAPSCLSREIGDA